MRELRFRAWNGKKMIYEHSASGGFDALTSADILKQFENVMQFTGLRDKNGKEIFEGDLVQGGIDKRIITEVIFSNGAFAFDFGRSYLHQFHPADIEVLGNIYSNPELLEAK